jgi:hypothetical protein
MDNKMLIGIGFVIFATLSTQLNMVMFRHYPKITGSELAEQHPELAWITIAYPILSIIWFLIFGMLPIYLMISSASSSFMPFQATLYILGGAIGSISILHGLLGFLTNVFPIPRKRNRLYVYDDDMQMTAMLLLATGIFVIIIALATIYFYVL